MDDLTVVDGSLRIHVAPPQLNIQFHHGGTVVGRLWLEDDQLRFEGSLESSAAALFEAVRPMVDAYMRGRAAEGQSAPTEVEGVPC